jgi:tetratricopeptide (TPR) repeat protein
MALRAVCFLESAYQHDRLGNGRDAALAYEDAAHARMDFAPALRGIRNLARSNQQWEAVCTLLAHEAEISVDLGNRTTLLLEAAALAHGELRSPVRALTHLRRLLQIDPLHRQAFDEAHNLLEQLGEYGGMRELIAARVTVIEDPAERVELLRRQAVLERDRLSEPRAAVATLRRAADLIDTDVETFSMLAALEEGERWWQDAADHHRRIAELTHGTPKARAARLREAAVREQELGDRDSARTILEELVSDPKDLEAAELLARLCERMGAWDRACELYSSLAAATTGKDRIDYLLRLADASGGGLDDLSRSGTAVDDAFRAALTDGEGFDAVLKRFAARRNYVGFAEAAERALQGSTGSSPARARLHEELAQVYAQHLDRADLAEQRLETAVELAPEDVGPRLKLAQTYLGGGRPENAVTVLREALAIDALNVPALRGLGAAHSRAGMSDAGRVLEDLAEALSSGTDAVPDRDVLSVKRALNPDELAAHFPRAHATGAALVASLIEIADAAAAGIWMEAVAPLQRAEELPEGHPLSRRVWSLAAGLGTEPLRLMIGEGADVSLVSDGRFALSVGRGALAGSNGTSADAALGRVTFEAARLLAWISRRATLGILGATDDFKRLIRALMEETKDEEERALRKRVHRGVPRKVRKELERFSPADLATIVESANAWFAEEQRWNDRIAYLLARSPSGALAALGHKRGAVPSPRVADLVRWTASDAALRAFLRLQNG